MPEYCWSCTQDLTVDLYVWIDEKNVIPCCKKCWGSLTVEQRLKLAQAFRDRLDGGVIDAATAIIRASFGRFIEERGGDEWLRGRGN